MITSKLLTPALFLLSTFALHAQHEQISPLEINLDQVKTTMRAADIYIYKVDTLGLPVLDDFSTNKFRKYNAKPTDPNVTAEKFYRLVSGATPFPAAAAFSTAVTNLIQIDTLPDGRDTVYFTPLPSQTITVNNLTQYPVTGTTVTVYPCYNIVDTVYLNPEDDDTIYLPACDLLQDSVNVYTVESVDQTSAIWLDSYAYHNYRYPVNPPTLGVATFDGLDDNGYPYNFSFGGSAVADALTSKPIDLSLYPVSDSVYLSFFYQPQGRGDAPESGDSLVLEFYNPALASDWQHIWSVPGSALKHFEQVMIPVDNPVFFTNHFQFRFKNYGSIAGSIDHWHIDYVFLDRFRTIAPPLPDTIRDDVAFQYQGITLLNNQYTSMPWTHFKPTPNAFMRDTVSVSQRNNNNGAKLIGFNFMEVSYQGTNLFTVNNPSVPSVPGYSNFKTIFDVLNAGVVYDTSVNDTLATFDVMFRHNTTPDDCRENDTMRFSQTFANYYAYDDGSAEAAYGPVGVGAGLAYGFNIVRPDSLYGIGIHFSPSVNNLDTKTFFLTVWDNAGAGGSPGNIIYQESVLYDVVYGNALNKFHVYPLSTPLVVSGNIYVGWQQSAADKLNIGFDYNTNSQSKIYYNVGTGWLNTGYKGSMMMRPVFKWAKPGYIIGVTETAEQPGQVTLYPNPADNIVNIRSGSPVQQVMVTDITGKNIALPEQTSSINTSEWARGLYIVTVITQTGKTSHRLVVQ